MNSLRDDFWPVHVIYFSVYSHAEMTNVAAKDVNCLSSSDAAIAYVT